MIAFKNKKMLTLIKEELNHVKMQKYVTFVEKGS